MIMEITVKIKRADGTEEVTPIEVDVEIPEFDEFEGPDNFREIFDKYERAVLEARNRAARLATEKYLAELSKKKLYARVEGKEGVIVREEESGFQVQAELGHLDIATHCAGKGSRALYNTQIEVFPHIGPKEAFRSSCFDWLECKCVSDNPYRKCEELINRLLWQDSVNEVKYRTMADSVVKHGRQISAHIEGKAQDILSDNHFDPITARPDLSHSPEMAMVLPEIDVIPADKVGMVIAQYNAKRERDRQIDESLKSEVLEDPGKCVNISLDDVLVTQQKEGGRSKDSPPKESKQYVKDTVIHVQQGLAKYILVGLGMMKQVRILMAFLLYNDLLADRLVVFFIDGADDIKDAIKATFGWRPYKIILDWLHLKKKCQERSSMGMKGRKIRNEALAKLLPLLWLGKVQDAIEHLKSLDDSLVKDRKEIEKLIAYFERNRDYIPCYALRKRLGLRISSNRGEKANDLTVSRRQKNNGMSWSKPGSSGLANVTALFLNNEDENWTVWRQISFKLRPCSASKCMATKPNRRPNKGIQGLEKKCA